MYTVPMIFPGQASQAVGMAQDLLAGDGPGARFLASADAVLGESLTSIMFEGPAETLTETRNAQPAILAHSVAVALELREMGIRPSLVAGHSLGEFSAAAAVGALQPEDALRVVRRRGELMFAAGQERPGTMAAVMGLPGDKVAEICAAVSADAGVVVLANHNSDAQVAISGEVAAVEAAGAALKEAGARRVIGLNVSGAFHSPLLDGAAREFAAFLEGIEVCDTEAPLLQNVSAGPATAGGELKAGFAEQLTSPVRWHEIMERIAAEKPAVVLEVGPGKVLTNLAKRAYPEVDFLSVGTREELAAIGGILAEKLG